MAIRNEVDQDERIVYTYCEGEMVLADFKEYIARIWSDSTHFGYNELFDASQGDWTGFEFAALLDVAAHAAQLTSIDPKSKLAWVIQEGKQKELTDFYTTAKAMLPVESRSLQAFYSRDEAMAWLTG